MGWDRVRLVGILAAIFAVVGWVVHAGNRHPQLTYSLLSIGALLALGIFIREDSIRRGRGGGRWLAACIFLAPIGLPLFLITAVVDRFHGRRGIESVWDESQRWYFLAALVLVGAAGGLALAPLHVTGASGRGGAYAISGNCQSALAATLGTGPFRADENSTLIEQQRAAPVSARCATAAGTRIGEAGVCLAGALLLAFVGASAGRRDELGADEELPSLATV